jgi:protein ImuB
LGDESVPRADPAQPWPGQLPEPSPTVLLDDPVELFDADGNPVRVTGRGLFSADPARLAAPGCTDPKITALLPGCTDPRVASLLPAEDRKGRLSWWAGPWPVDERWWDSGQTPTQAKAGRTARVQVLLDGDGNDAGRAMLLCYRQRRWYLEGMYE